jgi:phosphate starvation-inducible protein PhoH and related proteins
MSQKRRRNKQLSEEDIKEMETFLNRNNIEEDKLFSTISINVKCKTENQKKLVNSIKQNEITICSGLPGSGKTFLSCAESLKLIKSRPRYKRIVLVKSIVPLKNEEIGHLPGDLKEKMAPIMESFTDNIRKLIGMSRMEKLMELGVIEIVPIAFARGRSIDNSIILIDEAQNISMDNIRTLMTRIGNDSKMVIMGDVRQKDIRNKKDSSLEIVLNKFKNVEGFGTVELRDPEDVVRNKIIKVIEDVFESITNSNEAQRVNA